MEIYADNAASARMNRTVLAEMLPYLGELCGNPSSSHSAGRKAALAVKKARETVADILGADAEEIYFTSSGTESDDQAILTAAEHGKRLGKTHIVSSVSEHHAVLHTLSFLEKNGFEVTLLPTDGEGYVSAENVMKNIREDTCLVTLMYANNEIGTVMPIAETGAICRERNVLFHTDAVAAAGHLPLDVRSLGADMASLSAHKFGGPKGAGILFCKKNIKPFPILRGGEQERGTRAGTENVPAIVGAAAALREAYADAEKNNRKLLSLRDALIDGLEKIPHSVLNGGRENRLSSNVNFSFEGIEGESLLLLLDTKGICASSGSACTSRSQEPSHVLLALGRERSLADASLRLSLSADNTEEEVYYIIRTVTETVEYLRSMSQDYKDKLSGKREFILK